MKHLLLISCIACITLTLAQAQDFTGKIERDTELPTAAYAFSFDLQQSNGTSLFSSGLTQVQVVAGFYTVNLQDLFGATYNPVTVFSNNPNLQLEISFNDGLNGLQTLDPAVSLVAVPYAYYSDIANTVVRLPDSIITQYLEADEGLFEMLESPDITTTTITGDGISGVTINGGEGSKASLTVSNIGSSGQDGVSIDLGDTEIDIVGEPSKISQLYTRDHEPFVFFDIFIEDDLRSISTGGLDSKGDTVPILFSVIGGIAAHKFVMDTLSGDGSLVLVGGGDKGSKMQLDNIGSSGQDGISLSSTTGNGSVSSLTLGNIGSSGEDGVQISTGKVKEILKDGTDGKSHERRIVGEDREGAVADTFSQVLNLETGTEEVSFNSTKVTTRYGGRDAASGLPTGKRQHIASPGGGDTLITDYNTLTSSISEGNGHVTVLKAFNSGDSTTQVGARAGGADSFFDIFYAMDPQRSDMSLWSMRNAPNGVVDTLPVSLSVNGNLWAEKLITDTATFKNLQTSTINGDTGLILRSGESTSITLDNIGHSGNDGVTISAGSGGGAGGRIAILRVGNIGSSGQDGVSTTLGDLTITKELDKATPKLIESVTGGTGNGAKTDTFKRVLDLENSTEFVAFGSTEELSTYGVRDAATGLPTGKRQHYYTRGGTDTLTTYYNTAASSISEGNGHVTVLKSYDKSTPRLAHAFRNRTTPDSFFDVFYDFSTSSFSRGNGHVTVLKAYDNGGSFFKNKISSSDIPDSFFDITYRLDNNTIAEGNGHVTVLKAFNSGDSTANVGARAGGADSFFDIFYAMDPMGSSMDLYSVRNRQGIIDTIPVSFRVNGDLNATGTKNFKIDHPLDPYNKYLVHHAIESPSAMNVYNGNVVTDDNGSVTVELPTYFEALNVDFRYQLTVIGTFAQAIVKQEIKGNQFVIQTNEPNVKVSWQVTGVRNDPYMQDNPSNNEPAKEANMIGKLLYTPASANR